ncbi:MAG: hypothetical protein ACXVLQ_12705 [Bacteriovorax sp.]
MKQMLVLLFAMTVSSLTFAADQTTATRSAATYSCSVDKLSIVGSDGSLRACWPYLCSVAACNTYCQTSDQCQDGSVCQPSTGECIPQ